MGQEVKNLLRTQSKYGLMGSSAKTGKKNFRRSQEQFFNKTVIRIGHPPPIYQMQCICVGEGSRVPNLQTEFNYLDSFKSYCMYSNCKWPPPWSHPCLSCLTCMCIRVCMHACMYMCTCMGHSIHSHPPTPPSTHPTYPQGVTPPNQLKCYNT